MNRRTLACGVVGLALIGVVGCGSSDDSVDIGKTGDKTKASRVLEIRQLDPFRFEPATLQVKPGETVTLKITNAGSIIHEFTLGDKKTQDEHESEMKAMGTQPMTMPATTSSITIEPGATEELTWAFPQKGKVMFGCHEPGHYAKGMQGVFNVA